MSLSTKNQFYKDRVIETGLIIGERLTKPVVVRYTGLALWQIVLASSVAGLGAVATLDYVVKPKDDDKLDRYLETTFPLQGLPGMIPVGLPIALWDTGKMIGTEFNPFDKKHRGTLSRFLTEYVSNPIENNPLVDSRARQTYFSHPSPKKRT